MIANSTAVISRLQSNHSKVKPVKVELTRKKNTRENRTSPNGRTKNNSNLSLLMNQGRLIRNK